MKKTKAIDKYFEYKKGVIVNTVDMKVIIPKLYESSGLMTIEDSVKTLGVFRVEINKKEYANIIFLNILDMSPSVIETETIDDTDYYALYFGAGSDFINNREVIRDATRVNSIYNAFLGLGKLPSFLDYDSIHLLFDKTKELCNINLGISRCVFEIIYAHMYRDSKDLFVAYRNTDMKKAPTVVPLHKISHGPTSSLARMSGGYMKDGIIADLVTENSEASEVENLLRA